MEFENKITKYLTTYITTKELDIVLPFVLSTCVGTRNNKTKSMPNKNCPTAKSEVLFAVQLFFHAILPYILACCIKCIMTYVI